MARDLRHRATSVHRRHLENRIAYRIQELAYGGLKPETFLERAVSITDQRGQASCVLTVSPAEPIGTCIAVIIDAAGQTETVIYRREQAAAGGGA